MLPPIEKRIIQTAKHRNLPLKHRAMRRNLELLHRDYEFLFFDDEDVRKFFDKEFPEYRKVFDSFRFPIQRYDFFRYLAVYRFGGFYFDLDVLLATELSPLLPTGCVFPFEGLTLSRLLRSYGMDWEIGNYAFGANAGHPFLRAAIDNCVKAHDDPRWVAAMMSGVPPLSRAEHFVLYGTGPGLLSRTLAENPALAETVTVLFPDDVCDIRAWHNFGDFGIHLMEGSWRLPTNYLQRRLAQTWETMAMQRRISQSRRLGRTRRVVSDFSLDLKRRPSSVDV